MRVWEFMEACCDPCTESPIAATDKFVQFHGNYCGPGNRGGPPIDALDKACFKHDCEYDRSYKEQERERIQRQVEADKQFVKRAIKVANDKTVPKRIRVKAFVAAQYFSRRIARHDTSPPKI